MNYHQNATTQDQDWSEPVSFQANVLRVMIASPGDVSEERRIVTEAIHRWNDANSFARKLVLSPVKWETHSTPRLGEPPQTILNRQILDDADIVVGIFGTRIGTATEKYLSGTVEEIKKHVAAGKTAKVYFSDVPIPPSTLDSEQYASVQQFKDECRKAGLYGTYASLEQFREEFSHHLDIELNQPRYLWLALPDVSSEPVSTQPSTNGMRLLTAAAATDDGTVIFEAVQGQPESIGGQEFTDGSSRSAARWRGIVKELLDKGFWEQIGEVIYRVTELGFAVVDAAREEAEAERRANSLSERAAQLLAAAISKRGEIVFLRSADRDFIQAGGQTMPDSDTPRQMAVWIDALEELQSRGFAERRSKTQFQVTNAGYQYLENVTDTVATPDEAR